MAAGRVTTLDSAFGTAGNGSVTTLELAGLEQRALRLEAGAPLGLRPQGRSTILFVVAGEGTLRLGGAEHAVGSETAVFLADGEDAALEAATTMELVQVLLPPAEPTTDRVVRYGDEAEHEAGIGRQFRLLACCSEATQFVGIVPPGRANMHNHPYDEVAVIVEGDGVLHWEDGSSVPVGRGSCIAFPRLVFHSLENVGTGPIRIMGVFAPAGSPADRVSVLDY